MSLLSHLTFNDVNDPLKDTGSAGITWTELATPEYYYSQFTKSNAAKLFGSATIKSSESDIFNLGNKDFTCEFWFNFETQDISSTHHGLLSYYGADMKGFGIYLYPPYISAYASYTGSNWDVLMGSETARPGKRLFSSVPIQNQKWYHIALVRKGTKFSLFLDGKLNGDYAEAEVGNISLFTTGYQSIQLGRWGNNMNGSYIIDDFRFYNTAKYTTEFIPLPPFLNFIYSNLTIGGN